MFEKKKILKIRLLQNKIQNRKLYHINILSTGWNHLNKNVFLANYFKSILLLLAYLKIQIVFFLKFRKKLNN